MREILTDVRKWIKEGKQVAIATVIKTWGSSPRKAGSHMAINSGGEFIGSVSGGCIESAIIEEAQEVLKTGGAKLLHYGISDKTAWGVGLACGGEIEVFIRSVGKKNIEQFLSLIGNETPFSFSMIIKGPISKLGQMKINKDLPKGSYPRVENEEISGGSITKFVDVIHPPPVLVIVGGVHIAIKLAQIAKVMDYKTIVIDPRRSFSTKKRFPEIDQLITSWPQEAFKHINLHNSTAIVVLAHDPKIDDPALLAALDSDVFYIGALGSVKTHEERKERLRSFGYTIEELERIKSPVGLDIGSSVPSEIALGIMAEIVAVWCGLV